MRNLVAALTILLKYADEDGRAYWSANSGVLYAAGPPPFDMLDEDIKQLKHLGWYYNDINECWYLM